MFDRERLGRTRILVVGDVMLDRYWFGSVERISPEAPVPIVRVENVEERPGGAANVAMNVASIGAQCTLVGVVGTDEASGSLRALLGRTPIDARLTEDETGKTVTKLRMVSQNQQLLRADFDGRPGDAAISGFMTDYLSALDAADVVVVSDYGKGGLTQVERIIAASNAASKPVLVDPKGVDYGRYANATILTPNLHEFEAVAGPVADVDELRARAAELVRELNLRGILITRGSRGMVMVEEGGRWFDCPVLAKEVYDVSGAGDTVIAAYGVGYALGLPSEAAVTMANAAAGVVVGKLGTATASCDEIDAVLDSRERGAPQ